MNSIKINGVDYKIKYTIRSLFLFETITNKPFKIDTLLDNYVFLYCLILANNPDNVLDWDDFIAALDNDPKIFIQLNDLISKSTKIEDLIEGENTDTDGIKKN